MNRAYQHTYTTLTIDTIYQALDHARSERIETECLFVTQRGRRELNNLAQLYRENHNTTSDVITFLGMRVVVLPTLPENTLRIGPDVSTKEGETMTEEEASDIHRRVVESGLFDTMKPDDYLVGDIVAIRHNGTAHKVLASKGDMFLLYNGTAQCEVARNDIRPASEYVRVVSQIVHPDKEMHADRHGHGITVHRMD